MEWENGLVKQTFKYSEFSRTEKRENHAKKRVSALAFLLSTNVLLVALFLTTVSPTLSTFATVLALPTAFASFVAYTYYGRIPISSDEVSEKVPRPELPDIHSVSDKMLSEEEFSEKMESRARDLDRSKVLAREKAALQGAVEEAKRSRPPAASSLTEYNRFNQELKEIESSTETRLWEIDKELENLQLRAKSFPNSLAREGFPIGVWVRWGLEGFALGRGSVDGYILHTAPWSEVAQEMDIEDQTAERSPFMSFMQTDNAGEVLLGWAVATFTCFFFFAFYFGFG